MREVRPSHDETMKTRLSSSAKRARSAKTSARRHRPVHKRILLHPISGFLLLCVGVLVAGSTFPGLAASYDVTAEVHSGPLTQPAAITAPADNTHVTTALLNVAGSCPANSYIRLYREGFFSGTAICEGGGFDIQTTLSLGANSLQARVFNFTDDEGPASPAITVYYDAPVVVPAPVAAPTALIVSNVDQVTYQSGVIQEVVSHPTIAGWAPPLAEVTVTFYSEPSVCRTHANSKGVWTCTLPSPLAPGIHHVEVEATTKSGKKLRLPTFQVRVTEYVIPFVITSDYRYRPYGRGQSVEWKLGLSGGTPPYSIAVDWDDGSSSTVVRQDGSDFKISHSYKIISRDDHAYTVLISAIDSRGASTTLQLAALVRGSAALLGQGNLLSSLTSFVRQWLWVVWPAYIAVVLMAVSFWIGEKEAYQRFAVRRLGRPKVRPRAR